MSAEKIYTIGELAQATGVTTRTIRYYVAKELLPPPKGGGRAATYDQEHAARLELIKILKDEFLPLQEIGTLLSGLDHQAVVELLEEKRQSESPPPPGSNSAKAYLQTLLKPPKKPMTTPSLMRHKVEAQQRSRSTLTDVEADNILRDSDKENKSSDGPALATSASEALDLSEEALLPKPQPAMDDHQQIPARWQRIEITPEVELHIKEVPKNNNLGQKIERLIKVARQIFNSIIYLT